MSPKTVPNVKTPKAFISFFWALFLGRVQSVGFLDALFLG
jgi:hypothetical protein